MYEIEQKIGLLPAKSQLIKRLYGHRQELGLLNLFLNRFYLECVRASTSKEFLPTWRRKSAFRMDEPLLYI